MGNLISIKRMAEIKQCSEFMAISDFYDEITTQALEEGTDIKEVAAIMANRLGELMRLFDGDKEALKGMVYNIIHERTYKELK